jgi:hypothetical protein
MLADKLALHDGSEARGEMYPLHAWLMAALLSSPRDGVVLAASS